MYLYKYHLYAFIRNIKKIVFIFFKKKKFFTTNQASNAISMHLSFSNKYKNTFFCYMKIYKDI